MYIMYIYTINAINPAALGGIKKNKNTFSRSPGASPLRVTNYAATAEIIIPLNSYEITISRLP
jgi:hypothetical protein